MSDGNTKVRRAASLSVASQGPEVVLGPKFHVPKTIGYSQSSPQTNPGNFGRVYSPVIKRWLAGKSLN